MDGCIKPVSLLWDKEFYMVPHHQKGRVNHYRVCITGTNTDVGYGYLVSDPLDLAATGNIGFYIKPEYRNLGYGYSTCEQLLEKAARMGWRKLLYVCQSENIPSGRIVQKLGGKQVKETMYEIELEETYCNGQ